MPIFTKAPIELTAKTFNKYWVTRVDISSPSPLEEAQAFCILVPYNDNGEVAHSHAETLTVNDIMQKSQDTESNIAKAMHFLLLAINDEYIAAQGEQNV